MHSDGGKKIPIKSSVILIPLLLSLPKEVETSQNVVPVMLKKPVRLWLIMMPAMNIAG